MIVLVLQNTELGSEEILQYSNCPGISLAVKYNEHRLHGVLGNLTPADYLKNDTEKSTLELSTNREAYVCFWGCRHPFGIKSQAKTGEGQVI